MTALSEWKEQHGESASRDVKDKNYEDRTPLLDCITRNLFSTTHF
jgi:hypothetical protein